MYLSETSQDKGKIDGGDEHNVIMGEPEREEDISHHTDDVRVNLKITPVKNRRGRPKRQRNVSFKRKG